MALADAGRQRALRRERWIALLIALPAGSGAYLLTRALGSFSQRPLAVLALLAPLAAALVLLGRPLLRERRLLLGGGFLLFFLAYFTFFAIAAGTRILDGRRAIITGYEDATPGNFLGLNRLGDWHYGLAPPARGGGDVAIVLLPSFAGTPVAEARRTLAGLISQGIEQHARGMIFDFALRDTLSFDRVFCVLVERARQAGLPVVFAYELRQRGSAWVREALPSTLQPCLHDENLASVIGVREADGRIRNVLASRPDDPSSPSMAVRAATLLAGAPVAVPANGLVQFVPPASTPVQIDGLPDDSTLALLRDRFVFVGAYRPGDTWDTPWGALPGVTIQTWAAQALRTGSLITHLPLWLLLTLVFAVCWLLTVVQAGGGGTPALLRSAGIMIAVLVLGAVLAMRLGRVWADIDYPVAATILLTILLAGGATLQGARRSARPALSRVAAPAPPDAAAGEAPAPVAEPFDVFVSYNGQERDAVLQLGEHLRQRRLRVWLDVWELAPGRPWQEGIEQAIATVRSALIIFGEHGVGPWEEPELRACLEQCVARRMPVIPVLLPGAPARPVLPLFLRSFTWVDLRGGLSEDALDRLEWGITGIKPRSTRAA